MSEIARQIVDELEDKFDRHPVWVWYDSAEQYAGVLDEVENTLAEYDVSVGRYDGSYFELKRRLWEEDPDIDGQWLFYIPESRNDALWFRDIHKLGKQYRPQLDIRDEPAARYLIEHSADIPPEYDEWGTDPEQLTKAFLCVLFDERYYSPPSFVVKYLTGSAPKKYGDLIERYEQDDAWGDLLKSGYGIDAGLDEEEIATQILFGEVEDTSPTEGRYAQLAAEDTEAAADLCDYWRRNDTRTYVTQANSIASNHDLRHAVVQSDSMEWNSQAFKQIDDGLLQLCLDQVRETAVMDLPTESDALLEVVERRMDDFWFADGYVDYWNVLNHGLRAVKLSASARNEIAGEQFTPRELTERYAADWWLIDAEYRRYIEATNEYGHIIEGLATVSERVTHHYTEFLKTINRTLADGIADAPTVATPQTGFWNDQVTVSEGTAVIICDALRYELARELEEDIEKGSDSAEVNIETDVVSAALPSVTEVGMAAHLPGTLSLQLNDGLEVSVDDEPVKDKASRVERFKAEGFTVCDLSDIKNSGTSELESAGLPPRIVYSGTIDTMGENLDDDDTALSQAANHVDDVETVIQQLRSVGYTDFVVTADHGFLYTERLSDELKVEAPSDVEIVKRRFAATTAPSSSDERLIRIDASDLDELGINADDLTLLFPRSVACFKAPGGNMRYFHGGISMQELAVPCLTLSVASSEGTDAHVELDIDFPKTVTNNIVTVTIRPIGGQLSLGSQPSVILRAMADGREVCEPVKATVPQGNVEKNLRLKTGELRDASSVVFEAIDPETRETIQTQRARIDMLIQEDLGFDV